VSKKDADKDLFSDDEDKEKEALKGIVDFEPGFVVLDNGLQLGVYSRHKSTQDLLVLLDEKHLEQAFEILTTDAPPAKRPYKKKKTGDLSDLPAIPDEATQAYYHSWNRRQNDVLVRQQQNSGTAGDGHQQEAEAPEAAPGHPPATTEPAVAAEGPPSAPTGGDFMQSGFNEGQQHEGYHRLVPPASWMPGGAEAAPPDAAQYTGGGCCPEQGTWVHGIHPRAALELQLRFLDLVFRRALELHPPWFLDLVFRRALELHLIRLLDLVFRPALELHLRFLDLVFRRALELHLRFLDLVFRAALELHLIRLLELVLRAAVELHLRFLDLVLRRALDLHLWFPDLKHRLGFGAKDLQPRAAGNLVVGRCIRQLAAAILLVGKAFGWIQPPEWGGHGAAAQMMPPEWGGHGATAEMPPPAEDPMTAPGVPGKATTSCPGPVRVSSGGTMRAGPMEGGGHVQPAPKLQSGWLPRMVTLLAALDMGDRDRVAYLRWKFSEHSSVKELLRQHKRVVAQSGYDPRYDF
ncbi:unnamed protein product, partial [Symbiodinium sp. KB8]